MSAALGTDPATDQVLVAMLTENTGRSLCDSGDYYGRGYQRRIAAGLTTVEAWQAKPAGTIEAMLGFNSDRTRKRRVEPGDWAGQISVFHWLSERCNYHERLDSVLQHFLEGRCGHGNVGSGFASLTEFADWLGEQRGLKVSGFDTSPCRVEYTYNYDNCFDTNIQFMLMEIEGRELDGDYAIVQTHNGCDARSGLSTPRVFMLGQYDGMSSFLDYDRYDVSCEKGHSWMHEGSGSWLWDGGSSDPRAGLLKRPLKALNVREHGVCDVACPICGSKLEAYPYPC